MFSVALSVASCLRAGTEVHVAWVLSAQNLPGLEPGDAVALTPGGGRMGALGGGMLDSHLAELSLSGTGCIVDVTLSEVDALIAGVSGPASARIAVAAASALPEQTWGLLMNREALAISARVDDGRLSDLEIHTLGDSAPEKVTEALGRGTSSIETPDRLVSAFVPVTRLVISGGGPNARALEEAAGLLGWQVDRATDPDTAAGLMATLSPLDGAVVMGHDVESSSRVLGAALESAAGYIGALGSLRMQQNRADWLAYRGVTDLERVHGPAGIDIHADTPAEIAVSVLAEAIAVLHQRG
jgi:xanthine dehydrogenase accessory factor